MADGTDDERGESYLEIQMDRSTIVLAAVGLAVLLAASFLLGSWFGSRSAKADAAAQATSATEPSASEDAVAEGHDGAGEEVASENGFGGDPVSARGAKPVSAVPSAARITTAPPPGPSPSDVAEEEVAPPNAGKPQGRSAAEGPRKPGGHGAAKPSVPASTVPSEARDHGWIIQVAAVNNRAEADTLAGKLRKKGWPVRVVEEKGWMKVQVGPYDTKSAAQSAETRLKREERVGTWIKQI